MSLTHSRPYKKNDNAHVTQKNWSHVRQLLVYDGFEIESQCALIDKLYRECWEPLNNYFGPSTKLLEKRCEEGKIEKRQDAI